jgi:hypothetical protein
LRLLRIREAASRPGPGYALGRSAVWLPRPAGDVSESVENSWYPEQRDLAWYTELRSVFDRFGKNCAAGRRTSRGLEMPKFDRRCQSEDLHQSRNLVVTDLLGFVNWITLKDEGERDVR